ncbi:hypothetical protein RSOLAG22IIIB_09435 [Rhizoctonia solani]|uniref:Uncharacterized protein n=1 Tax=Rhizoctonia solani TaxID=456999 RepID=A0A0K6FYB6_9AGAM|nr:hypothetical protein RSOLAG22IIIB_09435 [Rhizoctonia solani]
MSESGDFIQGQAKQALDQLANDIEGVFSKHLATSEGGQLDETLINKALDEIEQKSSILRSSGPGNSITSHTNLTHNGLAVLHADQRNFVVALPTSTDIPGITKAWGKLQGTGLYKVLKLPLGFYIVVVLGVLGKCIYVSLKPKPEIEAGQGIGNWT